MDVTMPAMLKLTWHALLLLLLSPISVYCVNKTFNYGSMTADFNGQKCVINDVIRDFHSPSDAHCAYLCVSDVTCGSFFYHHDDKACVTCASVYYNPVGLDTYPGMSYYITEGPTGLWNEWSAWTLCSATCAGGTRSRTRTCNDTVTPCLGATTAIDTCNTYACLPLARTCAEWASRGFNETRTMAIDPDGSESNFSTVGVDCDLDTEPGKSFTVMHHDKESRTRVSNKEICGSYKAILGYTVGFEAAKHIADISDNCRQFVQWECQRTGIYRQNQSPCTFWRNRNMEISTYFTGPYASGKYCYCGDQGNCGDPTDHCNCDRQPAEMDSDGGDITLKSDLPIYSFDAGDTGSANEYGYHTVGPLICW